MKIKSNLEEETMILNLSTGKICQVDFNIEDDYLISSWCYPEKDISSIGKMLVYTRKESKKIYHYFDLVQNKKIWSKCFDDIHWRYCDGKYLFGVISGDKLLSINIETGEELWKFDASVLGYWKTPEGRNVRYKIGRWLGIFNDKIFLTIDYWTILALDIRTGEKIFKIKSEDSLSSNLFLDLKQSKIIGFFSNKLTEIDLTSQKIKVYLIEEMKPKILEADLSVTYDENHYYFVDNYHRKVGALNRKTRKIDWVYDFVKESNLPLTEISRPRNVYINQNLLYVFCLDKESNGTLVVFEHVES